MTPCDSFVFRRLTSAADLAESFRLRYTAYARSRHNGFVSLNADEIDIDEWDAFSQHFGVYTGGGRLVSTLRVVGTERTQAADILTK